MFALSGAPGTPWILSPPQSLTFSSGTNVLSTNTATFTVRIESPTPVTYQWQFEGVDLPGATNASLVLSNVSLAQAGAYRVRVANTAGAVTSDPAQLLLLVQPSIYGQPQAQPVVTGGTVSLSVWATPDHPTLPMLYFWKKNLGLFATTTSPTLVLTRACPESRWVL